LKFKKPPTIFGILTLFNTFLLSGEIPLWVFIFSIFILGLAFLRESLSRQIRLVATTRYLSWFLALAGVLSVYFFEPSLWGPDALICALVILAACKHLEANTYRDWMFQILLQYFLLLCFCLEHQGFRVLLVLSVDIIATTAALFYINQAKEVFSWQSLVSIIRVLGLSLPVLAAFFFLFPRFSNSFFSIPRADLGATLFAEDLNPGSIEKLVQSEETVFRVSFQKDLPHIAQMYWRGRILGESHGLYWRPGTQLKNDFVVSSSHATWEYELQMEKGQDQWLFILDFPTEQSFSDRTLEIPGLNLKVKTLSLAPVILNLRASAESPEIQLSEEQEAQFLQIPPNTPDKLKSLIQSLQAVIAEDPKSKSLSHARASAKILLDWFQRSEFSYSKNPGFMKPQIPGPYGPLMTFLFSNKKGFCEHYATSFATLLRLMKVPTRVVIGFQGGEKNEFANILRVRGLDAHAWVEVWEPSGRASVGRWLRMDPTAYMVPDRLSLGGDFNRGDDLSKSVSLLELQSRVYPGLSKYLRSVSMALEAAEIQFNSFINAYDFEKQQSYLAKLGFQSGGRESLLAILIGLVALLLGGISWRFYYAELSSDPIYKEWQKIEKILVSKNFIREPHEGVQSFLTKFANQYPSLRNSIIDFLDSYQSMRFGEFANSREEMKRLKKRRSVLLSAIKLNT
jgi:transglutaminase-like putative cysteine protease